MARLGGHEYWDARAHGFDRWNDKIVAEQTERLIDRWLRERLDADASLLDLGSGTGRYADVVAPAVARVTATDLAPKMLAEARRKLSRHDNVEVRQEDSYATSFANESFDIVVMGNLLHIVAEPERVLAEAHRLLRPGGRLLAIDYTSKGMALRHVARMAFTILRTWGLPSTDNRIVDPDGISAMAQAAGFRVVSCALIGPKVKAVVLDARR